MSKKFFINNLDTDFGQALFSELVKEPTEDPLHMCTVRVPVDSKPNGIKKILKREKPKLFTKKMIEQCEVYVYNLGQTEISDVEFGIQAMNKPFEDNKVFIFVSDILAWSNSGKKIKKDEPKVPAQGEGEEGGEPAQNKQQENKDQEGSQEPKDEEDAKDEIDQKDYQEPKPIEYTFFQDSDYESRKPLEKYEYIKEIQDKVLAIKKENVKVFVVCPGLIYGCGEDALYPLFRAAWLQQPQALPYIAPGQNLMPMIHMKDLVKFVIKVAQNPPEGPPYLLAIDQNPNKTHKAAIQSISKGIGSGKIAATNNDFELFENIDRFRIDLDMKPSKQLIGTAQEPVEFEWTARQGIDKNILKARDEFCEKHSLRPIKIMLIQNEESWTKKSKLDFILSIFSKYYRIPVLEIKEVIRQAAEFGDEQLRTDIQEQLKNLTEYINQANPRKIDETLKVLYRLIRWRLTQNDCKNRGFILLNFPNFSEELQYIFKKLSLKKLKRKKPKEVKKPKQPVEGEGEEGGEQQPPEQEKQQEQAEEEAQEEGEGPKMEPFMIQSIISLKQAGKQSVDQVVEFFTTQGIEELIYDTTETQEHEIFESMRNYLERNGRPNNYLEPEEDLLKKHLEFTNLENKESLAKRQKEKEAKIAAVQKVVDARNKIRDEIAEIVRTEGQEQIKKMPFRNYLMQFVVPTLNEGLLEVSNIIPNDPVDLLAEYLYQKSYDF